MTRHNNTYDVRALVRVSERVESDTMATGGESEEVEFEVLEVAEVLGVVEVLVAVEVLAAVEVLGAVEVLAVVLVVVVAAARPRRL